MDLHTPRLTLTLESPSSVLLRLEEMPESDRAQVSPAWLARVLKLTEPDPWTCGFNVSLRDSETRVGACGFKSPPSDDGTVEIAYGIDEPHRERGYATETARALVDFAFRDARVRTVLAHTLLDGAASQRVLTKAGFHCVGNVVDPDDGLVSRWEMDRVIA